MKGKGRIKEKEYRLRKHAEALLSGKSGNLDELAAADVRNLIHELQAHQIELEMQNEELRRTQSELEESRNKYADLYDFAPVGYFTLDERGIIVGVSLTGAALLGVERSYLIKQPFSFYVVSENQDGFYLYRKQLLDATRQTCELKMLKKDRTPFYARLEGIAVFDGDGSLSHFRMVMLDITESRRSEESFKENFAQLSKKNRYETIISTVTRSVHQTINLQEVLENAVEAMSKNIDVVEHVAIYLVEGEEAVMRAQIGFPGWFIARAGRIPYPKGFTWKAIIEGKPGHCADVDGDTAIGPAGKEVGIKSYEVISKLMKEPKTLGSSSI